MSEWKPIKAYDPEIGSVIVATDLGHVGEASYHDDVGSETGWWWINTFGEYYADPIHIRHGNVTDFMPMPPPPNPNTTEQKGE